MVELTDAEWGQLEGQLIHKPYSLPIKSVIEYCESLRQRTSWRKVEDETPDPEVDVLCFRPTRKDMRVCWYDESGRWFEKSHQTWPTYWMPLPDLPEEEKS